MSDKKRAVLSKLNEQGKLRVERIGDVLYFYNKETNVLLIKEDAIGYSHVLESHWKRGEE